MQNQVVSRDEWRTARLALLKEEKELTRRSDELTRRRSELPWVRIDKDYRFETDDGVASLKDLFKGRSQLLVYHFMFGPDYTSGCPSCSMIADAFNGVFVHLANHGVTLSAVSRSSLAKAAGVQAPDGLDVSMGLLARHRLQLRLQRLDTEDQQLRRGRVQLPRGGHPLTAAKDPEPVARLAASCGTDGRHTCASVRV